MLFLVEGKAARAPPTQHPSRSSEQRSGTEDARAAEFTDTCHTPGAALGASVHYLLCSHINPRRKRLVWTQFTDEKVAQSGRGRAVNTA